ncbi:MAG: DUF4867 family protein [Termitinemataceae bacterium]
MTFKEELQQKNPDLQLIGLEDFEFLSYGRPIREPAIQACLVSAANTIPDNLEENRYVASVPELEGLPCWSFLTRVFGGMDVQIGYVAGPNRRLNGLEYHKSSEVLVALTDQVLLLGLWQDIERDWTYDASKVIGLFVPAGSCIELYPRTLHFSPCRLGPLGFKTLIMLPRGTNTPLPPELQPIQTMTPQKAASMSLPTEESTQTPVALGEDRLLFMRNKWLLAHPERTPLIEKGAFPGIKGRNIEIQL